MNVLKKVLAIFTIIAITLNYQLPIFAAVQENAQVLEQKEDNNKTEKKVTFDQTVGINAFIDDPLDIMSVAGTVREYHNFSWTLDKANENKFGPSYVKYWNFDNYYKKLYEAGITVMPCIQGTSSAVVDNMTSRSQKPIVSGANSTDPLSYRAHASTMFQYAARYGSRQIEDEKLLLASDQERVSGLGYIEYYENWNEPDKTWEGAKAYFSPEEMAAMCSADYDGHEGVLGDTYGVKNADPNAKLVMGGVCNNSNLVNYLEGMKAWSEENRTDKQLPIDVINFHMYTGKGCPESSLLVERCNEILNWRDENASGKEVWLTEFGWDTNTNSLLGATQEHQRDWLMRTYLITNALGIDRSTMYMIRDAGNSSDASKYSTCGLTTKKDQWTKKSAWYGVYTLKNALTGYVFDEIVTENEQVYVYKFINEDTEEICYVLWSPTEDGSSIENYSLNIGNYEKAKLTTFKERSTEGETQDLEIISNVVSVNVTETPSFVKVSEPKVEKSTLKETKIGIGGCGALFEPAMNPHNSNEILAVPDMGGLYISHDQGLKWDRVNMYGTTMCACYDPNLENVVYAGGSGLWRSTDYGRTFEMIFPREDDLIVRRTHSENSIQQLFTRSNVYDRGKQVKNILIDPEDSNHIFILSYYNKNGKVYESKDNGENFEVLFTYQKTTAPSVQFDFNELIYRRETHDLFVINNEFIQGYNLDTKNLYDVYTAPVELVDVTTVYENGETNFVIIEKVEDYEDTNTIVYYTNDFEHKTDITDKLISVQPTYFDKTTYGHVTYKYEFHYISATSVNNIYVTNWTYQTSSSGSKNYPYTIDGIIRYHDGEANYLYGNPFWDHNHLASRLWCDGNTYSLGIAASYQNEDEFIFTTLCGIYYAPDNTHIHPRYGTVVDGKAPTSSATYVTSGIDEQATYGVALDPFHEGVILLLNTDLGLIRSEDNGQSWKRPLTGIPSSWTNTIYDAMFDERHENVVYSLWSGRHNAPYSPSNEATASSRNGGFAISYDGGQTWDATYSSGLPSNSTPVKMSVVYPEDTEEATIYVATFNNGYYVSYDSGKTFTEINEGIERVRYNDDYSFILGEDIEVKDGRIFALTARSTYNGGEQPGKLYEYINGRWENIELPNNCKTPRDIYYCDGTLYITGTCTAIWHKIDGVDFYNVAGGVYTYKDGNFEQIFDERISTTSVVIDSKGTIFVSDMNGNIYRKTVRETEYTKIYDSYHYRSESLQITDDDDTLYLASFGGGMLRLENLNSLYDHECVGGEATCTQKAICEICGEEYGKLDPNNHSSSETRIENSKEATCEEEGYTGDVVYDCCGKVKENGTRIEKLEHEYDQGTVTKEATYFEAGERTYKCLHCTHTRTEEIPIIEHEHNGGIANCTNKAVCVICGAEYGEINENVHSANDTHIENSKEATCKEEGYTGDVVYDCCGKTKENGTIIPTIEHKFGKAEVTKEPTYDEEGEKTSICKDCGAVKTEYIPKLERPQEDEPQDKDEDKIEEKPLEEIVESTPTGDVNVELLVVILTLSLIMATFTIKKYNFVK